jgi:spermidine synthase
VRIAGRERERLGNVAGGLFALSTFGSLGGTLAATFLLIPLLALDRILALLVAATALSALLLLEGRGGRLAALAVAAVAFAPLAPGGAGGGILVERATPYQTIVVTENGGRRLLASDGVPHSQIDILSGEPTLHYPKVAETLRLFTAPPRRALLLGMGGGSVGAILAARYPELASTYAEIDPAMVDVARAQFGFVASERLDVVVADGRRYVADHDERWDWIYCDTYIGQAVPFHLATLEFFELLRSRLAPEGAVGLNLAGRIDHPFALAIVRTLRRVFARVEIFSVRGSGNFLLVGHDGEPVPDSELAARAAALDAERAGPGPWPRFAALARQRVNPDLELDSVPVLVDGYAPVDALLHLDAPSPRLTGRLFAEP